jgi:hypothetical protein
MTDSLHIELSLEEANLVLSALGNLPYLQVHQLINSLQNQLGPQLVELEKIAKQSAIGKEIKRPDS